MSMIMPPYYPVHHPDESALLNYAAGASSEAAGVMIASHLALCPHCRAEVARLEALGGALLGDLEPTPLESANLGDLLERLDALDTAPEPTSAKTALSESALLLPQPLRSYVGDIDALPWRKLGKGIHGIDIAHAGGNEEQLQLLRIKASATVPRHTHLGTEMLLILSGGLTDAGGHYVRGDLSQCDATVDHGQVADADVDCFCLSYTDAPLHFTGPLGWLINFFKRS
jgi:putative transcriptional regulator